MRTRIPSLAALALLALGAAASAQTRDAVELLPAQTLACVDLRHPQRLARELNAVLKGWDIDGLPRRLAERNQAGQNRDFRYYRMREQLAFLSIFLSPEGIDEGGRMRGGFVALTGFGKDGTPEVVGALQPGSSNFPGVAMRAFRIEARQVGEAEGVPLYREVHQIWMQAAPGQPNKMEERPAGPVVAQLPGLLLFGTSNDSLAPVIRRSRGRSAEASLTSLRAFREAAAVRVKPGLFFFADAAALEAQLDEAVRRAEQGGGRGPVWPSAYRTLLGKDVVRNLTASLTLNEGALEGRVRLALNAENESPLLGLLPDRPARRELLHYAPADSEFAVCGGLGDGDRRWKTFLNLMDALHKLEGRGDGPRPSAAVQEMEKKLELNIARDILAPLTGAGCVIHMGDVRKPRPVTLLLQTTDAEAATKLVKSGLPRVLSLGRDEVQAPAEDEVAGQRIWTVQANIGPPRRIHYGRHGSVIVLGPDRESVAAALTAGRKKGGLLADEKIAAALKDVDENAAAFGVVSTARVATHLMTLLSVPRQQPWMKAPAGAVPPPPPPPPAEDKPAELSKAMRDFQNAAEPMVFGLSRKADAVTLELRPLSLRRMVPRLLDAWVDSLVNAMDQPPGVKGGFGGGGVIIEKKAIDKK